MKRWVQRTFGWFLVNVCKAAKSFELIVQGRSKWETKVTKTVPLFVRPVNSLFEEAICFCLFSSPNTSTVLALKSTAAIVVSRRCFICLQLSILHTSCRRVCGVVQQFPCNLLEPHPLKASIHHHAAHLHPHLRRSTVRRFPFDLQ